MNINIVTLLDDAFEELWRVVNSVSSQIVSKCSIF